MPQYEQQTKVVGNVVDFKLRARKDGAAWDITGGTVTLTLERPDGTLVGPLSATVTDGAAGAARCLSTTSTLDVEGDWSLQWQIVVGSVVERSVEQPFYVGPSKG